MVQLLKWWKKGRHTGSVFSLRFFGWSPARWTFYAVSSGAGSICWLYNESPFTLAFLIHHLR